MKVGSMMETKDFVFIEVHMDRGYMVLHCIGWGIRILISRLDIVIIAV
jgi:hypothetical protein